MGYDKFDNLRFFSRRVSSFGKAFFYFLKENLYMTKKSKMSIFKIKKKCPSKDASAAGSLRDLFVSEQTTLEMHVGK